MYTSLIFCYFVFHSTVCSVIVVVVVMIEIPAQWKNGPSTYFNFFFAKEDVETRDKIRKREGERGG